MSHADIQAARRSRSTSAEPDEVKALQICQEVLLAQLVTDCHELPVKHSREENETALWLLRRGDKREAQEYLHIKKREHYAARNAFIQDGQRWAQADVLRAALVVERAVQARLVEAGGVDAVLPATYARKLWDAQWQAHRAVVLVLGDRGGHKRAKELQIEAATGVAPLTVCVGRRIRRLPEATLRKHAPDLLEHYGENIVPLGNGDGCFTIMEDGGLGRPSPPKAYCQRCAHYPVGRARVQPRLRAARHPQTKRRR